MPDTQEAPAAQPPERGGDDSKAATGQVRRFGQSEQTWPQACGVSFAVFAISALAAVGSIAVLSLIS